MKQPTSRASVALLRLLKTYWSFYGNQIFSSTMNDYGARHISWSLERQLTLVRRCPTSSFKDYDAPWVAALVKCVALMSGIRSQVLKPRQI